MRTVVEEEEEEIADHDLYRDSRPDRELTISSTTLLAIFFGLVLLCGLFFGLGYSLGRRSSTDTGQLPAANTSPAAQPSGTQSKPSAAAQTVLSTPTPAIPQPVDASASKPEEDSASASPETKAETPTPQTVKPVNLPQPQSVAAAPQTSSSPAAATPPAAIMVQIAAVSNPADADVLVRALQKRGYSVSARRTQGDAFIHVQVGPFSTRADAVAMRQKLLSDGYNAIVKP
jgi:DedD protein